MSADLIARLEAATGPDRELDARIQCSLDGHKFIECEEFGTTLSVRSEGPDVLGSVRYYTASIDAALTLVPELSEKTRPLKLVFGVSESGKRFGCFIDNWAWGRIGVNECPNWPIALCIAALKARAAIAKAEGKIEKGEMK